MTISRRDVLVALGVFVVLSLVYSWPLLMHLGDRIPGSSQPVDPMHILYGLTSGAENLTTNPFDFFSATFLYPYTHPLSFLDQIFFLCVMAAPVLLATGNMLLSYNVVWLSTFALSGLGAYCLVGYLTRNRTAAYLGGILYAFHPLRFHSAGILHVVAMMGIPFALLALHSWVHSRQRKYLFWFAGAAVAQFLCSGYTGVFLILAVLVYLAILFLTRRRETWSLIRHQKGTLLITALGAALLLAPLVAPTFKNLNVDGGPEGRSLGAAARVIAPPPHQMTPAPGSLLGPLAPFQDSAQHPLFPGVVGAALAAVWILGRRWRGHRFRTEMLFYLVLSLVALILSFGPLLGDPEHRIPLPFALAYFILPGASLVRAPVRFIVLTTLGVAVMAGAGWSGLGKSGEGQWSRRWLGPLVVVLTGVELFAGSLLLFHPLPDGVPSIYDRLVGSDPPVVILELPMPATESDEGDLALARYQLYSLDHGQRLVNGISAYVPPITREVRREMQTFPDPVSVARLQSLGVRFVFLHEEQFPAEAFAVMKNAVDADAVLEIVEERERIWMVEVKMP